MSNFYPNALNGYTQFYGTSPASNQANTVFGTTGTTMSGGFNALYGYQQQTMGAALPTNQAHRSSSLASSVPSIYSTFVQPSYQSTAAASSAVGFRAGAHGAVGGPVPKPITKPVAPVQLQPGASAYDSLVYNTAAQMIQQQHQAKIASLQPRYQQSKNNKAYGRKPFNKESQLLYCEICKISCAGKQTMQEHMDGQKHKKKEAMMKGENSLSLPRNKVSFRCDLCGVTCTGQDTYEAHIRGSKHQKTVALVRKRGGEVPVEPTIIPPTEYNCQTGLVSPAPLPPPPPPLPSQEPVVGYAPLKRVIGISTVSFVPSTKSTTTSTIDNKKVEAMTAASSAGLSATELAISAQSDDVKAMIAAEASVTPVGESYIESEKDAHGKLIQYICKLCDCKFSDPNAKDIHLKGRRHRLQYKLKVDPKLVVEVKVPPSRRVGGRYGGPARPLPNLLNSIPPWFGPPQGPTRLDRRIDTVDDRHVQIKLLTLDPGVEFLTRTEAIAKNIEAVVKLISDYFGFAEAEEGKEPSRIIQALNRVGIYYDQLLINGDDEIEFICSCLNIPDQKLLFNFSEQFKLLYRSCGNLDKKFTVNVSDPSVIIHFEEAALKVRILLTSKLFREEKTEVPLHALNKEAGLLALAKLRRDKWFGACCQPLCSATPTIRLLRDLKRRRSVWSSLTDWMCMLLVENILSTWQNSLSVGDAFRRVMEAVASGFLSPIFPGLPDPCETGKPNVLDDLSVQQREDLMFDAQAMVRMISFHQIYKVLGIERLPDVRPPLGDSTVGKKRPLDENNGVNDVKKDKRDGEDEETELSMDIA